MTRTPKNPAAEVTPVPHRRVARTVPGEPAVAPGPPRGTAAGGKTSTQPQERAAAGTTAPAPVTGDADPAAGDRLPASPGRGRTETPAGRAEPSSALPAGTTTGRTFTIALPAGLKLLSLNDRLHYGQRYRRSQDIKKAACVMALKAKVPRLERVSVVVEYQPRDRRERDADNISPSGKAALDGIVAAKVLADDSKTYVTGVRCTIGEPYPLGRLVLHLTEVTA